MEANGSRYAPVAGKIPGTAINLGGVDLVIAPLSLDQVQQFEEDISKASERLSGKNFAEQISYCLPVIHAGLTRNYPDLTQDELRKLLDIGNFIPAFQAVVRVSGFEVARPGETPRPSP